MFSAEDLTEDDLKFLHPFALKVDTHMPGKTFEKLPYAFPQANLSSWKRIQARITQLSGFQPERYDCCMNSCCCFVGPHSEHGTCLYCAEPRCDGKGQARKSFIYLPIIPRLKAYLANPEMAELMEHRGKDYDLNLDTIKDVYDLEHYKSLRKKVMVNGCELSHCFFKDP